MRHALWIYENNKFEAFDLLNLRKLCKNLAYTFIYIYSIYIFMKNCKLYLNSFAQKYCIKLLMLYVTIQKSCIKHKISTLPQRRILYTFESYIIYTPHSTFP